MTDPARAARLTAIAERRRKAVAGDPYPFADIDTMSAHVETLTQQVADERLKRIVAEQSRTLSLLGRSSEQELREDKLRIALAESQVATEQAEQQRDAAHAALTRFGKHTPLCATVGGYKYPCTCGLDAALAASAPQKEK